MHNKFNPKDMDPYLGIGTGEIEGQAFLRQRGGGIVTCAGEQVFLFPNTPFMAELMRILAKGREPSIEPINRPQYRETVKESICDAQGNFAFMGLKAGSWIVITDVNWTVDYTEQGDGLMGYAHVHSGRKTKVILTDKNRL